MKILLLNILLILMLNNKQCSSLNKKDKNVSSTIFKSNIDLNISPNIVLIVDGDTQGFVKRTWLHIDDKKTFFYELNFNNGFCLKATDSIYCFTSVFGDVEYLEKVSFSNSVSSECLKFNDTTIMLYKTMPRRDSLVKIWMGNG